MMDVMPGTVQAAAPKPLMFTLDRNEASKRPISTSLRRFVGALRLWANVIGSPDSLFLHSRHGSASQLLLSYNSTRQLCYCDC